MTPWVNCITLRPFLASAGEGRIIFSLPEKERRKDLRNGFPGGLLQACLLCLCFFALPAHAWNVVADTGHPLDEWPAYDFGYQAYELDGVLGLVCNTQPNLHFLAVEMELDSSLPAARAPSRLRRFPYSPELLPTAFHEASRCLAIGGVLDAKGVARPVLQCVSYVGGDALYFTMSDPLARDELFGNPHSIRLSSLPHLPVMDAVADRHGNYFFSHYGSSKGGVFHLSLDKGRNWTGGALSSERLQKEVSVHRLFGGEKDNGTSYPFFLECFENGRTGDGWFSYQADGGLLHLYHYLDRNGPRERVERKVVELSPEGLQSPAYTLFERQGQSLLLVSNRVAGSQTRIIRELTLPDGKERRWEGGFEDGYGRYSLSVFGGKAVLHDGRREVRLDLAGKTFESRTLAARAETDWTDNRLQHAHAIRKDGRGFRLTGEQKLLCYLGLTEGKNDNEQLRVLDREHRGWEGSILSTFYEQAEAVFAGVQPVGGSEVRCLAPLGEHLFYRGQGSLLHVDLAGNGDRQALPVMPGYHAMTGWLDPGGTARLFAGGYWGAAWTRLSLQQGRLREDLGPFVPKAKPCGYPAINVRLRDFLAARDQAGREIILSCTTPSVYLDNPDVLGGDPSRGQLVWFDPLNWTGSGQDCFFDGVARFYTSASGKEGAVLDDSPDPELQLAEGVECVVPCRRDGEFIVGVAWHSREANRRIRHGDLYRVLIEGTEILECRRLFAGAEHAGSEILLAAVNGDRVAWTDYEALRVLRITDGHVLHTIRREDVPQIDHFGAVYPWKDGFVFSERVVQEGADLGYVDAKGRWVILDHEQMPLGPASIKGRPAGSTALADGRLYIGSRTGYLDGRKSSFVYEIDLEHAARLVLGEDLATLSEAIEYAKARWSFSDRWEIEVPSGPEARMKALDVPALSKLDSLTLHDEERSLRVVLIDSAESE